MPDKKSHETLKGKEWNGVEAWSLQGGDVEDLRVIHSLLTKAPAVFSSSDVCKLFLQRTKGKLYSCRGELLFDGAKNRAKDPCSLKTESVSGYCDSAFFGNSEKQGGTADPDVSPSKSL